MQGPWPVKKLVYLCIRVCDCTGSAFICSHWIYKKALGEPPEVMLSPSFPILDPLKIT